MNTQQDDVNLIQLVGKLFEFIKGLIVAAIRFIARNLLLFIICSVAGLIGGYLNYKYSSPVYKSEIIVSSNYLQNNYCSELIDNLNALVKEKSFKRVSEILNIPEDDCSALVDVEFSNFNEDIAEMYKGKDTVVLGMPFRIKILAGKNNLFDVYETGICNYFDSNPYVKVQKELRENKIRSVLSKLETDIKNIDSLKLSIEDNMTPRAAVGGFVFGEPLDPINIYREGINLYKEKLRLSDELVTKTSSLQVITPFERLNRPYRPRLYIDLIFGVIIGLGAGVALVIMRGIRAIAVQ